MLKAGKTKNGYWMGGLLIFKDGSDSNLILISITTNFLQM